MGEGLIGSWPDYTPTAGNDTDLTLSAVKAA